MKKLLLILLLLPGLASAAGLTAVQGGTGTSTWITNSIPYFTGFRFTENNSAFNFDGTRLNMTYASSTAISVSGTGYFGTASSSLFIAPSGSQTNPPFTFSGDTDTGIYSGAANFIQFTTNGSTRLALGSSLQSTVQIQSTANRAFLMIPAAGTQSAPTYSITGDTNTGLWSQYADALNLTVGGTEVFRTDNASTTIFAGSNGVSWNGTAWYPVTDNARDLGIITTNNWRNLYTTFASTTALSVSGTSYLGTVSSGTWNGTAIDISDYTNLTAGDALTLTGDDIDFDGGATPAGDLGGTWASPSVTDDSHAHTGATLSGIDVSGDTNLTAGDGLTLTDDDLDCDTASALVFGCLTAVSFSKFNSATTTAGTGLTYSGNAFNVNTSQNISTLSNLTSDGFVKTSGGTGALSIDTTTYESGLTAGDGLTRTVNDFDCDAASGSVFGCLSAADWTTFNNKLGTSLAKGNFIVGDDAGVAQATSTIFISSTGNIGIGTAAPDSTTLLDIQQTGGAAGIARIMSISDTAANGAFLYLTHHRTSSASTQADDVLGQIYTGGIDTGSRNQRVISFEADAAWGSGGDSTDRPIRITFSTANDGAAGPTERMRINAAGSVGIGATTPLGKLSVETDGASNDIFSAAYGSTFSAGLNLYSTNGTQAAPTANETGRPLGLVRFQGFDTARSSGALITASTSAEWGTAGDASDNPTDLQFFTAADGAAIGVSPRLVIASTGNIGISSTTPWARLSVVGAGTSTGRTFQTTDSNNLPSFTILDNGTIGIASSSPSILWGLSISTTTVMQQAQFAVSIASSTTASASETVNWNTGNTQRYILGQNTNFIINATSSNPLDGGKYTLKLCQDPTGSRTATFVTPGQLRWSQGTTTIDSTANECTFIGMIYDKTYSIYNIIASSTDNKLR